MCARAVIASACVRARMWWVAYVNGGFYVCACIRFVCVYGRLCVCVCVCVCVCARARAVVASAGVCMVGCVCA